MKTITVCKNDCGHDTNIIVNTNKITCIIPLDPKINPGLISRIIMDNGHMLDTAIDVVELGKLLEVI